MDQVLKIQTVDHLVYLKYFSLIILTGQNAIFALSLRYSRTRIVDNMYISSTAILMAEFAKLFIALCLVYREEHFNFLRTKKAIKTTVIDNFMDTVKVCVPSVLYLIQNNLIYVAASNLDVATYQVTYQLKILTTAIFSVLMLGRSLFYTQWSSLILLIIGVVCVQLSDVKETVVSDNEDHLGKEQNKLLGLTAAFISCMISGLAGVYFEKILKGCADVSIWMRNVQLSLLSIPLGFVLCFVNDGGSIMSKGFFIGYDCYVWYMVLNQAAGGLIVASVVKYADNILKGFACSLAIIITSVASVFIFGLVISRLFVFGAGMVVCSILLYQYKPAIKNRSQVHNESKS